jgi:hypothetical protein
MELKYLFRARFSDGTKIQQTPEDQSTIDPRRSAYFDVLRRIDDVVSFSLENSEAWYSVSLEDGRFSAQGVIIEAQPCGKPEMPAGGKFKLIYFRDHTHTFVMGGENSHEVAYRFGWEYTVGDKTWTQTLVLR